MKKVKKMTAFAAILIVASALLSYTPTKETLRIEGPEIQGKILIDGKPTREVELEAGNVVSLFKDFKTGRHNITFSFDSNDVAQDEQGRGVVLFEFTTSIYDGNKKIESVTRKPMPFFPGEMLEPVETFDIINVLTYAQGDPLKREYPGKLAGKGNYRVVIAARPVGAKGSIKSAEMIVWI